MTGIGPLPGAEFLAAAGDMSRYGSADRLSSFAGVVVRGLCSGVPAPVNGGSTWFRHPDGAVGPATAAAS